MICGKNVDAIDKRGKSSNFGPGGHLRRIKALPLAVTPNINSVIYSNDVTKKLVL